MDVLPKVFPLNEDVNYANMNILDALPALKAVKSGALTSYEEEEDGEDSNTEISIVEPKPLSLFEANKSVTALRNFILSFDKSGSKEK
ncbi:hypothetical protein ACROYT_G015158 [Oculina patagonica]